MQYRKSEIWWQKFHLVASVHLIKGSFTEPNLQVPIQKDWMLNLQPHCTSCLVFLFYPEITWSIQLKSFPNISFQKGYSVAQYWSFRLSGWCPRLGLSRPQSHQGWQVTWLGHHSSSAEIRNASFKLIRTKFFPWAGSSDCLIAPTGYW